MIDNRSFGSLLLIRSLALILVSFSLLAMVWTVNAYSSSKQALLQRLNVETRLIADTIGPAIRFSDAVAQQGLLQSLQNDPAISSAGLIQNGELSTVFRREIKGRHKTLSTPVLDNHEQIATITVSYTDIYLWQQLSTQIIYIMTILGLTMLMLAILSRTIIKMGTQPLREIADVARKVVKDKSYNLRISYNHDNQVGDICRDMNIMLEMIERREKDLEQRVQSRTQALTKANQELEYLSYHDPVTNLPNRRKLTSKLESLGDDQNLQSTNHALVILDLDQFKIINDTCGHAAGDALLSLVGAELLQLAGDNDLVARLGGDEFALVLDSYNLPTLKTFTERLRSKLEDMSFHWQGDNFKISASIGACLISWPPETAEALFQKVDAACYAAKERGRNQVVVLGQNTEELQQRQTQMQWVNKVNDAIASDQFRLFGQTLRCLSGNDEPTMVEVLLRMGSDASLPAMFIPATDRYGVTSKIDHWVVKTLLAQLKHSGTADRRYWVNLSGLSISNPDFISFLEKQIKEAALPPNTVNFEITETAAVRNIAITQEAIKRIKDLGCMFSLDDFGSGMSSYNYLRHFDVDFIKIDGAFMNNLASDRVNQIFVKSILEMAQALDIKTVAECLETPAAMQLVAELGADYGQGYTIGRPQPLFT